MASQKRYKRRKYMPVYKVLEDRIKKKMIELLEKLEWWNKSEK